MNRAAAARPSGADAEPVGWELAAFEVAVHSDPIELAGAKRALKAFFFRLLPDIKVEDSFGEADQVLSTLMDTAGGAFSDPEDEARFAHQPAGEDGAPPRPDAETDYLKAVDDAMTRFDAANVHIWNALRQDDAKAELIGQLSKVFPKLSEVKASTVSGQASKDKVLTADETARVNKGELLDELHAEATLRASEGIMSVIERVYQYLSDSAISSPGAAPMPAFAEWTTLFNPSDWRVLNGLLARETRRLGAVSTPLTARLVAVLQHRDEELEKHCYKHISYNDPALRAKWKTALRLPGPAPEVIAAGESSDVSLSLFSTQTSDLNGFSEVTMRDSPFTGNDATQIVKISRTYLERSVKLFVEGHAVDDGLELHVT